MIVKYELNKEDQMLCAAVDLFKDVRSRKEMTDVEDVEGMLW